MTVEQSYEALEALDFQLIPRVLIKILCGILGAAALGLTIVARNDLEKEMDRISQAQRGTELNKAMKDGSQWMLTLSGVVAIHAFPMALYVMLRWHHPSKKNPSGRFSKFRITLMTMMSSQYMLCAFVFAGLATYFIGVKEAKFVPEPPNPQQLAERLDIELHFVKRGIWLGILLLAWAGAVAHAISFALELTSLRRFKRVRSASQET